MASAHRININVTLTRITATTPPSPPWQPSHHHRRPSPYPQQVRCGGITSTVPLGQKGSGNAISHRSSLHLPWTLVPPGRSCWGILVRGYQPTRSVSSNQTHLLPPELHTGSRLGRRGTALQAGGTPRGQPGPRGDPRLPPSTGPPRAPAQGHPARDGRGGGAEPDLPAVGGGGDRPGPSHGSAARHGGGAGRRGARGCGVGQGPGKGRRRRGWRPGAGPGRGATGGLGAAAAAGLESWLPALAMKRPLEPSGSDGESDGPIDVGREGELR